MRNFDHETKQKKEGWLQKIHRCHIICDFRNFDRQSNQFSSLHDFSSINSCRIRKDEKRLLPLSLSSIIVYHKAFYIAQVFL